MPYTIVQFTSRRGMVGLFFAEAPRGRRLEKAHTEAFFSLFKAFL